MNPQTYSDANPITPTDGLAMAYGALYVGSAGNLSVLTLRGHTVVFSNVPAGTLLPISVQGVNATGTTASNILGLS